MTAHYREYKEKRKYKISIVPKEASSRKSAFYQVQKYLKRTEKASRHESDVKILSSYGEAKELIGGLYNTDDPAVVQEIYTAALDSANESSVVIPLNYRNEYAVFNNEVIESYTFNSIPNHVDVAAIHLK